jgi:hypothetical protein
MMSFRVPRNISAWLGPPPKDPNDDEDENEEDEEDDDDGRLLMPNVAAYGSWKSPITSDLVAESITLSEARFD